jgi:tripartite-type tricarboxylate transporter receptor subunit TctC
LEEQIGGTIVVENREGGGGAVGNGLFASAEADGYTLVSTAVGLAIIPPITEGNVGYDSDTFRPLGMIGQAPVVLVVRDDSKYQTAEDLLTAAETERIVVADAGPLTVQGISLRALTDAYDLQLEEISFTGNAETMQSLISGEVDAAYMSADGGVTLPRIQSGDVRALAVGVDDPAPSLPDVPTLKSLGYDELPDGNSYWFLATQEGTPEPIVEELSAAMETCMTDPEIQGQIGEGVAPPEFISGESIAEMLESTSEAYRELLQ